MPEKIQVRRGTAAEWAAINPVLSDGEPGLEKDTQKIKYGDGVTYWNNLSYHGANDPIFFQSRFTAKTGANFVPVFDEAGYLISNGFTVDVSIAKLTVLTAGKYVVFFHQLATTSGGTYLKCRKNGVGMSHAFSASANSYDHSASIILDCAIGDVIDFYWQGTVSSSWSAEHSSVYAYKL